MLTTIPDKREYQITCHINYNHDSIPPILYLIHEMMDGNNHLVSQSNHKFTLIPREMALVSSLTCLVVNQTLYYHVIPEVSVIFNMIGETTSLQTQLGEIESDQLVIHINVTIPSYVWCRAFSDPIQTPTVTQVMESKQFFVLKRQSILLENLIPSTRYTVYCYGESVAHVTMRESLNDVKQVTVTDNGFLTFDSWKEDSKVQFTIKTNLHKPCVCSIHKNQHIEELESMNGMYESELGEDGCKVSCHVNMNGREYSIDRECQNVLKRHRRITVLDSSATQDYSSVITMVFIILGCILYPMLK